jgi:hypothetical protein
MSNTVEIIGTQQVLVAETAVNVIELTAPSQPAVVEVATAGPQGAPGTSGVSTLAALSDVDVTQKVDKSILYFDAGGDKWLGDDINTLVTITDGGHF